MHINKFTLLFIVFIFISSCNDRSEKLTIKNITQSKWDCQFKSIEFKRGVIGFPLDSTSLRIVNGFWPMLATESILKFDLDTYEFKTDKYLFKGKWFKKDSSSIYLLGDKNLFKGTIIDRFEYKENKNYLRISESKIIDLNIENEIEIFGGENVLFELKNIK